MWVKRYLFLLLFIATALPTYATTSQSETNFISIADIHFDPFAGCRREMHSCELFNKLTETPYQGWEAVFIQYGDKHINGYFQNADYPLLKSALEQISKVNQKKNPTFALVLGDFYAHNFRKQYKYFSKTNHTLSYEAFSKKTLQFLTYEIQKTFPTIDVYPVVGNNDSYTGNYSVIPKGAFLNDAMNTWSVLFKDKQNVEHFRQTFPIAGYYEITIPGNNQQKILVLNTVLFTSKIRNNNQKSAALNQLAWLHNQLLSAEQHHQHVIIACHIPMGIDLFATVEHKFNVTEFWQAAYTRKFEAELQQFSSVITAILPAHMHSDRLQFVLLKQVANIPVKLTTSISPIYGSNPSFKVFSYDSSTFKLTNTETYFYDLAAMTPEWRQE